MPMFSKIIENGKSRYIFEFSAPTLISIVGTVALCLVWSFILGIILGRGHSPEEQVPQLAQILPQHSSNQAPVVVEHNPSGIMRPEELQFRESLRENQPRNASFGTATSQSVPSASSVARAPIQTGGQTGTQTVSSAPGASHASNTGVPSSVTPAVALREPPAAIQPSSQQSNQPAAVNQALAQMERQSRPSAQGAAKPAAPVPATPVKTPAAKPPTVTPGASVTPAPAAATAKPADAGGTKYNYVYQVAASRDEKQAAAVVQKLASLGLQGRIEKQGDDGWCRILVSFTGTPDDTQKLRDSVAKIGIDRIIMRDKKEAAKR